MSADTCCQQASVDRANGCAVLDETTGVLFRERNAIVSKNSAWSLENRLAEAETVGRGRAARRSPHAAGQPAGGAEGRWVDL